tara:strand:- start:5408 stop:6043 length:636 start_codon:yes stop_codon:yes gene_type:complete
MDELDISQKELYLERDELNGSYIYKDKDNNQFNDQGELIFQVKFETLDWKNNIQQKKGKQQRIKKTETKTKTEMENTQVMDGAYDFTAQISAILVEKFDGKVMGSEDLNVKVMMKELWGDYQPGDKVKKVKKEKKKKKALTGYTFFGKENKEKFVSMIDENTKYVSILAKEWKKLSQEEKNNWDKKAKEAFKEVKDKGQEQEPVEKGQENE